MISKINLNFLDIALPIVITIIVVMIACAISIYLSIFLLNISKLEEKIIDNLYNKYMITSKFYLKFKEEIEEEIYADVKTL